MNKSLTSMIKRIGTTFIAVLFGVYFTYFLIEQTLLSPVIASSLCGLIASLLFIKKWDNLAYLGLAMYCGSFAGMGSVFDAQELIITATIVTILILISGFIFKGFGGKLGFIAYVASVISEISIVLLGSKKIENFSLIEFLTEFNPISKSSIIISVLVASTLGFYSTIYFHHNLKKSSVFASAFPSFIVGLMALLFGFQKAELFAITFFSASFVGMLAEDLLPKKHFLLLVFVHILTIILFKKNLGNYGGALGTIAFFSVFVLVQLDVFLIKRLKK